MGFNQDVFYIAWDACMLVLSLPLFFFALRTRWEYKGEKDRLRTWGLIIASICFPLEFVFELAADAYLYHPPNVSTAAFESTYSGLNIMSSLFALSGLLATAFIFFRTAIAMLYGMSKGRKLGLTRVVELASAVGFALIVIFAVVVWSLFIWYNVRLKHWIDAIEVSEDNEHGPEYDRLTEAYLTETKVAIAYEWVYFIFATIFLPIVFLQTLGRRTDRIAVLLYTFAILLVDALHVMEVVRNLVGVHRHDPLGTQDRLSTGLLVATLVANSLFELLALYCLAFMGMRSPKLLNGEDDHQFTPVSQQAHDGWPKDPKYNTVDTKYDPRAPAELPSAENRLLDSERGPQELPSGGNYDVELPGDDVAPTKPQSKVAKFLKRG